MFLTAELEFCWTTFSNAGIIIENSSSVSSISSNTGIVQNLNGGTFNVGSGNAAITATGSLWTGCSSTDWNTADNWYPATVPSGSDNAVISNVANKPVLSTSQSLATLNLTGTTTVRLGAHNLTVNNISGGNASNYVVTDGAGKLTINALSTTFATLFPIGASSSSYDPLSIQPTNSVDFAANVKPTASASDFSGMIADYSKVAKRQWDITPSATPGSTILSLTNGGPTYTPTNPKVGHYTSGNVWEELAATYSANTWTTTTTSFSPFGVGDQGGFKAVLPVTLMRFTARQTASGHLLSWTTTDEVNNKGFNIETSTEPHPSRSLAHARICGTTTLERCFAPL